MSDQLFHVRKMVQYAASAGAHPVDIHDAIDELHALKIRNEKLEADNENEKRICDAAVEKMEQAEAELAALRAENERLRKLTYKDENLDCFFEDPETWKQAYEDLAEELAALKEVNNRVVCNNNSIIQDWRKAEAEVRRLEKLHESEYESFIAERKRAEQAEAKGKKLRGMLRLAYQEERDGDFFYVERAGEGEPTYEDWLTDLEVRLTAQEADHD